MGDAHNFTVPKKLSIYYDTYGVYVWILRTHKTYEQINEFLNLTKQYILTFHNQTHKLSRERKKVE